MFGFFRNKSKVPESSAANPRFNEEGFKREFVAELEKGAHGEVNRVDAALVLRQSGTADVSQVLAALDGARLYSLVQSASTLNQPLIVKHPAGYGVVAIFSSPERAERSIHQFPEFAELLQMSFRDIVALLDERHGIVVNPLYEVATFQMAPQEVAALRKHFNDGPKPNREDTKNATQAPPPLPKYLPGEVWAFKGSDSEPNATLMILRVEHSDQYGTIVHVAVSGLTLPNGGTGIGHMPFTEASIDRSVTTWLRAGDPVPDFSEGYTQWRESGGGVFTITVAEGIDCIRQAFSQHR